MSVNKVILIGNVGQEPVIRTAQDGKRIATFPLATSDKWKDKRTNEWKEITQWHNIVIFNEGLVGVVEKFVDKGTKLFIEGQIEYKDFTDKNGVKKIQTSIVLKGFNNKLVILDRKDGEPSGNIVDNVEPMPSDDIPF